MSTVVSSPVTRWSLLTADQKRLVSLMSQIHFGRIESLQIKEGQPSFSPAPRAIRTLKVGGKNEPKSMDSGSDFELKLSVLELLVHIKTIGDGSIDRIEIAHGLPLLFEVETSAA